MSQGRNPGHPKTGGSITGSVKTHTIAVKEAVLKIFNEVNSDGNYLREIAADDRKLFLSLLARLIPTEVAIEQKISFDLGAEMAAAHLRLNATASGQPVIDVTPTAPEPVTAPRPRQPLINPRTLPAADQTAATPAPSPVPVAEHWDGY